MFTQNGVMKAAFCILIVTIVLTSFLGATHLGMGTSQMGGQMGPCPFMPGVAICNMTPLQHLTAAQSMFNAIPLRMDLSSLLSLLLALVVGFAPFLRRSLFPPEVKLIHRTSDRNGYIPAHNAFQDLFSSGILNPKAF